MPRPSASAATGIPRSSGRPEEAIVLSVWRKVLECDHLGLADDFFSVGGDSIRAIRIVSELRKSGLKSEVRDIFQNPTPATFSAVVQPLRQLADQAPVTGAVPLTPIQRWFFETVTEDVHHFNQTVILRARAGFDATAVGEATKAIWEHHDALRASFRTNGAIPTQHFDAADAPAAFEVVSAPTDALELATYRAQSSIAIATGPLFKAVLARGHEHDGGDALVLVAHHLVIDGVSWRILLDDFVTAYEAAKDGRPVQLAAKTESYRRYGEVLAEIVRGTDWSDRIDYWRNLSAPMSLPVDHPASTPARTRDRRTLTIQLDASDTREVVEVAARHQNGPSVDELLTTALTLGVARTFGLSRVMLNNEGHGREHPLDGGSDFPELDRTIGWFTNFFPVVLECPDPGNVAETLEAVRATMEAIPDGGRSYVLVAYHPDGPGISIPKAEIGCNYFGDFGASRLADGLIVDWNAPDPNHEDGVERPHLLDIWAMIDDGRFKLGLDYDSARWNESTAERLFEAIRTGLTETVTHIATAPTERRAQFTYGAISDEELDAMIDLG